MKLIQKGDWKKELSISDLLERKGCDEFFLLKQQMTIAGRHYELWWYNYKGKNHILAKQLGYPFRLYFFLLEEGDLFAADDFRKYMEEGILLKPSIKPRKKKESFR